MLFLIAQVIVFLIGVGLSLYVALWNLFILSIVDIVLAIMDIAKDEAGDGVAMRIAWDIFKIFIASFVGWLIMSITLLFNAWLGEWK